MHANVVLNGRVVPADDARISPLGDGFMYGLGLFETIKVLAGRPAFFAEHLERLRHGAAELGLALTISNAELRSRCQRCIAANDLVDGTLKLVVYQDADTAAQLIVSRPAAYPAEAYTRGFRLKTMPDAGRDQRLARLKTLNYLKNIRAKRAAEAAGFDEALFIDADGTLLEGAITNVFVVKDGIVHTPSLAHAILPGIARAAVLRLLPGEAARETALSAAHLFAADEVFVTNSLLGVMPVAGVDDRRYDLARNPVTRTVAEKFRELEAQSAAAE